MQRLSFGVLATLLALQGCTGVSSSDSVVTESFSGTLQLRSSVWHNFTVTEPGTATVTLTSLSASAPSVGLGIGKSANGCERLTWSEAAAAGNSLAVAAEAGQYCATVSDNGRLTDSAIYTVSVTHP
jgi:hypothetical protein